MLINLGDLSEGMGKIFIREFMETSVRMSCDEGRILFKKGEITHHFYTLIQGEFRLTIGAYDQHVYTVRYPGEIFGWSSIVGGSTYSATAVCTALSEILRFDRDNLLNLLGRHPASGFLFFKKVAEMLGKRLLECYRIMQAQEAAVH
ncbi:MAG: cyclic nucleotide-binding domain-containing protein [Desulforhopalus sp.]